MYRLLALSCLLSLTSFANAQTATQGSAVNDPLAVSLVQKAMAALTNGSPVGDVILKGNVTFISGSDNETGTGTFEAKGLGESRIELNLSNGPRTEVRNDTNGIPGGAWQKNSAKATSFAQHNCWTDASWFFPALSSLTQTANTQFVYKYVGQEQVSGVAVQHVSAFQIDPQSATSPRQRLSTVDFYLGSTSLLPVAIRFKGHADNDMNTDLDNEILFANYQAVNGVQVPFHFQRLINGVVVLDVTVTSAVFNTGLLDSTFSLQ